MKFKIIFSSLLIVSLLLTTTFTSVLSSSFSINNGNRIGEIDKSIVIKDNLKNDKDLNILDKNQYLIEKNDISRFKTAINMIKLIFRDNKEIVNICQKATILLQILPDSVCHIIYWFVISPISMILLNIWYNHPDYLIQYYAYYLYELLIEIYNYFCDWSPTVIFNIRAINGAFNFIEPDTLLKTNICPCMKP
jgi:hypothetical protein